MNITMLQNKKILFFFLLMITNGFKNALLEKNIPKQSSSLSAPSDMNGSASPEVLEPELATDDSDLEERSCCMTLKYSSSVFALAKRDWAFVLWARKVLWALTS